MTRVTQTAWEPPPLVDQDDADAGAWSAEERTYRDALDKYDQDAPAPGDEPPPSDEDAPEDAACSVRATDDAAPVSLHDFWALMPQHAYIFAPSRELWPAASVCARIRPISTGQQHERGPRKGEAITITAAHWLDRNRAVEQVTWAPGEPEVIRDRLVSDGGWIDRAGCACFNLYRAPRLPLGNPDAAGPWLEHLMKLFPGDVDHIVQWLAQRVQQPGVKINHALVLSGPQGIGKDTALEPIKAAIGPWNFQEIGPMELIGRFNGFVKSVILRVSEARDLGDINRYAFYEHTKVYTAAPPDVLRCDEKNIREYMVMNVCGVIITTNHKQDGLYLPADDRRHFVAWSERTAADFTPKYFKQLYAWLDRGGKGHVAAYLRSLDLSGFDPKAPPPKTAAFWDIVDANRAPEDAELADAIEALGKPDAATLREIAEAADPAFALWIRDRRNSRQIPHRLEAVGYVPFRNDGTRDGRWKIAGRNQVVYVRAELTPRDRHAAVAALSEAAS